MRTFGKQEYRPSGGTARPRQSATTRAPVTAAEVRDFADRLRLAADFVALAADGISSEDVQRRRRASIVITKAFLAVVTAWNDTLLPGLQALLDASPEPEPDAAGTPDAGNEPGGLSE